MQYSRLSRLTRACVARVQFGRWKYQLNTLFTVIKLLSQHSNHTDSNWFASSFQREINTSVLMGPELYLHAIIVCYGEF